MMDRKSEWISVNDELPESFVQVIVVTEINFQVFAAFYVRKANKNYDITKKGWYTSVHVPVNIKVTHWMPLPMPPERMA